LVVSLAAVVVAVVATVLLVSRGGGGNDKTAVEQPTQSGDEAALESLARRSIEVLLQGPS